MRLIVAEKPELGRAIADALGGGRRAEGHIVCGDDVVTWCFGHLLELTDPEDHDPATARWSLEQLPLRWPIRHKPIEDKLAQIRLIERFVKKAKSIVHAGDPDEEGQLLVEEVLRHVGNTKPVQRLLINDNNPELVRRALGALRDNAEFQGLYRSALARSAADQRYGYNLTRAYTLAARRQGGDVGVLSVGRVQTPILGLVVRRDRAHEDHEVRHYFELAATFTEHGSGTATRSLVALYQPGENVPVDEKGRPSDRKSLERIAGEIDGRPGTVTRATTEHRRTPPPLPYDLLNLQVDASRKFGLAPDATLRVTQTLRERHRLITYNRSDCRYLSDEQHPEAPAVLAAIAATAPVLARAVANGDASIKGRAFDSRHVTAHHAIVPTTRQADLARLSTDEARVYQLVARAYVAQFHPHERFDASTVEIVVEGHRFKASGRVTTDPGWKRLYRNDKGEATLADGSDRVVDIRWVVPRSTLDCSRPLVTDRETRPPPRYTMATLMADLARVAKYVTDPRIRALLLAKDKEKKGEHGGIGTPATRSAIIAGLIRRGYIEERSKQVSSTTLGRAFHDTLPPSATAPDMTALWHEQQDQIRRGETTLEAFLRGVGAFIAEEVVQAREAELAIGAKSGPVCPACTKGVMGTREGPKGPFLGCSRYPDCRHTSPVNGAGGGTRGESERARGTGGKRSWQERVASARAARERADGTLTTAKKATAKRSATRKAAPRTAPSGQSAAKKTAAEEVATRKAPRGRAPSEKVAARKTSPNRSAPERGATGTTVSGTGSVPAKGAAGKVGARGGSGGKRVGRGQGARTKRSGSA